MSPKNDFNKKAKQGKIVSVALICSTYRRLISFYLQKSVNIVKKCFKMHISGKIFVFINPINVHQHKRKNTTCVFVLFDIAGCVILVFALLLTNAGLPESCSVNVVTAHETGDMHALKMQQLKVFLLTWVLGPVHRGGRAVVDSSTRGRTQAASWRLEPWGVTGHGGTHCPAAGTTAIHPHVSACEGGAVKPD